MGYNIGSIDYLGEGRLRINAQVRKKLRVELGDRQPEANFLEDDGSVIEVEELPGRTEELEITRVRWRGEGSGRSEDNLRKALAATWGSADLLLTWEGGDSHSGLRVVDGKVTARWVGPARWGIALAILLGLFFLGRRHFLSYRSLTRGARTGDDTRTP
jgi:hypothetical protein